MLYQIYVAATRFDAPCQRIYLGVNRRKKKDKQRRAELGIKQEESEEATLPREAQGQQEALAENKGE